MENTSWNPHVCVDGILYSSKKGDQNWFVYLFSQSALCKIEYDVACVGSQG